MQASERQVARECVVATEPSSPREDKRLGRRQNHQSAWKRGEPNVPQPGHEAAWVEKEYELALQIAFAVEAFLYHGYPDWEVRDHAGDKPGRPEVSTGPWTGEPDASCAGGRLEEEGQA